MPRILQRAEQDGLATFTFADLAAGTARRAGICLSFDDNTSMRGTHCANCWAATAHTSRSSSPSAQLSADQRGKLHALYAYAVDHIAQHGLQAYLDDEVQPSVDILLADGFAPAAYAHPGGSHTLELDQAHASRIRFARSISGRPHWDGPPLAGSAVDALGEARKRQQRARRPPSQTRATARR